jgi:hypothetical protein
MLNKIHIYILTIMVQLFIHYQRINQLKSQLEKFNSKSMRIKIIVTKIVSKILNQKNINILSSSNRNNSINWFLVG